MSSIDDVSDFVITQGHGIKGLVDNGLKTLPEKYIQPPQKRLDMTKIVNQDSISIPIIDFSNWDDPLVAESICDAADKWGFFQIINHGVPLEVMEKVKETAHQFFELPVEEKRKYKKVNAPNTDTVVNMGTSFSPLVEEAFEWKDFLSLLYVSGDDSVSAFWPSVCRDSYLDYAKRCEVVLKKLLQVLLKRLNVKEIDQKEHLLMGAMRVNVNYYPICPDPELTVGIGRHSDVSTITILLQDDTGGLYVREPEEVDTWIHVSPVSGSLVINIGDVLQIMSNGRYKSIEHYVIASRSKNRVSVPIFVNPGGSAVISPLPEVLESYGEKPMYKEFVYSDYFRYFFSKEHDGKKTIDFAKI